MLVREDHRRPSDGPPYWPTGTQVVWREGDGPLGTGATVVDASVPHFAQPVTVVRDDADALVVWLSTGTPVLRAARADGLGKRDDPGTLFTAELVQDHADAATVEALVAEWGSPFCDNWEHFRPDPAWPIPGLPENPVSPVPD